jgi:outer membrane protein TolC
MRRLPRLAAGISAIALLLVAPPAGAEEPPSPPAPPAPAPAPDPTASPSGGALHGQLALSLQEAIAMGIENNLDVQLARFDPLIAAEDATAAWGYYDPRLFAEYTYSHLETPVASTLQQGRFLLEKEHLGTGGVSGVIPKLNWQADISYTGASLESTSSIQSLSPQYTAGLTANVTLPLLKDFLWSEPWLAVKSTQIAEGSSQDGFRQSLMDIVESIERSYWELVASEERLRVANKSLESNLTLLDQTRAQYDVGVVSRVEVVEAEAGVANSELGRITAENEYRRGQDQLIDVVLGPNLTPDSTLEIQPITRPDVVLYDIDSEAATAKAFENRPELAIARANVEAADLTRRFARNQLLPQVDAVGSYGYSGLAGRTSRTPDLFGNPRTPIPGIGRHYADTDDDFFSGDGARSWTAGGVFSIPIGNVAARAEKRRAELELTRARTQVRREEQRIVLEIRDAVRNLRSAQEGIEAAERRRLAAEEQFRAEGIRLEHGESTPFDVLQREQQLVEAESQKIAALQIYRNSLAALDRAQGTILRERNVVVEQARTLR